MKARLWVNKFFNEFSDVLLMHASFIKFDQGPLNRVPITLNHKMKYICLYMIHNRMNEMKRRTFETKLYKPHMNIIFLL